MFRREWQRYKVKFQEAFQDLKTKGRRKYQIPNILTSLRLLAPFLILPSAFVGNIPLVVTFIGVFSATDMLDGYIARTFHLTSDLGRDLDAFSDKIFAGTLLLAASFLQPILLINVGLEAIIGGINTKAKLEGLEPKSLMIGKIKTGFLFPMIGLSFLNTIVPVQKLFDTFLVLATLTQGVAIYSYERKYEIAHQESKNLPSNSKMEEIHLEEVDPKEKEKEEKIGLIPNIISSKEEKIQTLKEMRKILTDEIGLEDIKEDSTIKQYWKEKKDS